LTQLGVGIAVLFAIPNLVYIPSIVGK